MFGCGQVGGSMMRPGRKEPSDDLHHQSTSHTNLRRNHRPHPLDRWRIGEVGDIVIDPVRQTVTHLVVQPPEQHFRARLVPIELATVTDDIIQLSIDTKHLRSLREVAETDFLPIGDPLPTDPDWDVGTQSIMPMPMGGAEYGMWSYDDHATVNYDRIPRGGCEIRSQSRVTSSDGQHVGTVEGYIADDTHFAGVVVRDS